MDNNFSYSTSGFDGYNLVEALDLIAATGFSQVELSTPHGHLTDEPAEAVLRSIRQDLDSRGLRASTLHAPAGKNVLGAPEDTWRTKAVGVLAGTIRAAAVLGAPNIIIHPVPKPIFVSDQDTPDLHERIGTALCRSLDKLAPIAQEIGVRMLLENLPFGCDYPLLNLVQLRQVIEPYPATCVGLIIDTGHAQINGCNPADEIRAAGSRLGGTHLQDNDGAEDRHWVPGEGVVDWDTVVKALCDIGYTGAWTFEVVNPVHNETSEQLAQMTWAAAQRWGTAFNLA